MLRWKIHAGLIAVAGFGLATGVWAQLADNAEPQEKITNGGVNHTISADPVMGQPFSAEQVAKQGRTLNDGVNITHFGHHFVARDSAGRVRVEQPCGCDPEHEQKVEVYIVDPAAHTLTTWRVGGNSPKIATVSKLPEKKPEVAQQVKAATTRVWGWKWASAADYYDGRASGDVHRQPADEGDEDDDDCAGGAVGNDAPITKVHELWTSEDLKLTFMEQWEDPRTGVRTVALVNFKRAEPDPALFRVPNGYTARKTGGQ